MPILRLPPNVVSSTHIHTLYKKPFLTHSVSLYKKPQRALVLTNNGPCENIINFISSNFFSKKNATGSTPSRKTPFAKQGIKPNEKVIRTLIKKDYFKLVLPEIWAEEDAEYRIKWLKEIITTNPHPLLYLELSRFLSIQSKTAIGKKEEFALQTKTLAYQSVGFNLVYGDLCCFSITDLERGSYIRNLDVRAYKIAIEILVPIMEDEEAGQAFRTLIKSEHNQHLNNLKNLHSPLWIAGCNENCNIHHLLLDPIPKKDWDSTRKKFLETIVSSEN